MAELHNTGPTTPQTGPSPIGGSGQTGTPPTAGSSNADSNPKSPLFLPGGPESLIKGDPQIYNKDGYVGVDPQYQNGATTHVKPL